MIRMKITNKILSLFSILFLLLIILVVLLIKSKHDDVVPTIALEVGVVNPLELIDCEYAPEIVYWSWWESEDYFKGHSADEIKKKRQENIIITCKQDGTGHYLSSYVFRDGKLIFENDSPGGRFFNDKSILNSNDFYLIQQDVNPKAFSHPTGFILSKYQYNSKENKLEFLWDREYPGDSIKSFSDEELIENNKSITSLAYNQIMNSKSEHNDSSDFYKSNYDGQTIVWQGKISAYYSQITGIKFCVIDGEHQSINIDQPCDWFWAFSASVMDADDVAVNPNWDGHWVDYILNYYKVPFDKNKRFYDDVYTVTGVVYGLDCGVDDKCIPDIEIVSISSGIK